MQATYINDLYHIRMLRLQASREESTRELMSAYMTTHNIGLLHGAGEDAFFAEALDAMCNDLQHFAVACARYLCFADAGTLQERTARQLAIDYHLLYPLKKTA